MSATGKARLRVVSQNSLDIEPCPNSHPNSLYSAVKPGLNRPQAIWSWGTLNQRDSGCLGFWPRLEEKGVFSEVMYHVSQL